MVRGFFIICLMCAALYGQAGAYPLLEKAYALLQDRNYDAAIDNFRRAIEIEPSKISAIKDLAYTLLKIGENESARDEFAKAMNLDPTDHHVALEYAFLCYETDQKAAARRVFDRIRKSGDPDSRSTAEQAFQNIDRPLAEGIARWVKALETDPDNFSAHMELANLANQRDQWNLAAEHYAKAWELRPDQRAILLELGRIWEETNRPEQSRAALLAASRGAEPRVAEQARALLPSRYPYTYEFEQALELDSDNVALRREYAYLLLEMGNRTEAERQFEIINKQMPGDMLSAAQLGFLWLSRDEYEKASPLLQQVLESGDDVLADRVRKALNLPQTLSRPPETPRSEISTEAKILAERSLEAGYLADAMKYLKIAHETDPVDFSVMLKLGHTHNILKQDEQAVKWFDLARRSPDPAVAQEAGRAYRNLRPALARFRTTFWVMPFYSSRWKDVFAYAQVRTEVRLGKAPIRPYLSVRFTGDARQTIGSVSAQYLSESSFIFGIGVRTPSWKGITAWVEAGSDVSYLNRRDRSGRMAPDYRGGASFGRGFGNLLGGEGPGAFLETNEDGVFMSRFSNTVIGSTHNRLGYTAPTIEALGGFQTQFYWSGNANVDSKRQPWANFVETGPGLRFRWKTMPKSLVFSIDLLRGQYLLSSNPSGQDYYDIRAGFWYAITR